jgi:hypothetical protein
MECGWNSEAKGILKAATDRRHLTYAGLVEKLQRLKLPRQKRTFVTGSAEADFWRGSLSRV